MVIIKDQYQSTGDSSFKKPVLPDFPAIQLTHDAYGTLVLKQSDISYLKAEPAVQKAKIVKSVANSQFSSIINGLDLRVYHGGQNENLHKPYRIPKDFQIVNGRLTK
jgi:hypothetical protein